MKQIGENDKCTFYRTKRCEELEVMTEYTEKYGEGIRFIRTIFKDPKENSDLYDTYLVIDKDQQPIAEVTERTTKGMERILRREIEYLQRKSIPEVW